jgi:hypothetical protein
MKLPPNARDFEVFEFVVVGGKSTRDAATKFGLSQTRICQIVERMRQWQAEVVPQESPIPEERRLRLARHVAVQRIEYLYGEVMEAWRRSQGEVKKSRCSRFGDDVTTTFFSPGDPKYLIAAMRLAKAQADLGTTCIALYAAAADLADGADYDSFNPEPEATASQPYASTSTGRPEARPTDHPVEDCSAAASLAPAIAASTPAPTAATSSQLETSRELSPQQAAARRQLFSPVQLRRERDGATTSIQVTPDQLGLSVEDVLSRQKRQARKRARQAR